MSNPSSTHRVFSVAERPSRVCPSAFTLIELLVVIAIIGILAAIALAVGSKVASGGKTRATQQAITVLDQMFTDYIAEKGDQPSPIMTDPRDPGGGLEATRLIPIADARNMDQSRQEPDRKPINALGLFLYQAQDVGGLMDKLKGLDAKLVRAYDADSNDSAYGTNDDQMKNQPSSLSDQPRLVTVMDAFGEPIRYVHPKFSGTSNNWVDTVSTMDTPIKALDYLGTFGNKAQQYSFRLLRRNNAPKTVDDNGNKKLDIKKESDKADSDGGSCVANRAYFYSPGGDKDPSTLDDNVYTTQPQFNDTSSNG